MSKVVSLSESFGQIFRNFAIYSMKTEDGQYRWVAVVITNLTVTDGTLRQSLKVNQIKR